MRRGWLLRVASQEGFERAAGRTADPSATLLRSSGRDDKGRGVAKVGVVSGMEGPAVSPAAMSLSSS